MSDKLHRDEFERNGYKFIVSSIRTIAGGAKPTRASGVMSMMVDSDEDFAGGTPWPFETMVHAEFKEKSPYGSGGWVYHQPYATEEECAAGHGETVAACKSGNLYVGHGVHGVSSTPSMSAAEWNLLHGGNHEKLEVLLYGRMPRRAFGTDEILKPEFIERFTMKYPALYNFFYRTSMERWNGEKDYYYQRASLKEIRKRINESKRDLDWMAYASYGDSFKERMDWMGIPFWKKFRLENYSRINPLLIETVKEFDGDIYEDALSSKYKYVEVVEIPFGIDWEIERDSFGQERIGEKHKTWTTSNII